ncbi:MAG: hypothetical protein EPGJADBJ_00830 [Saprospiraceae bacterium]|nr:hypothetical protein [Saprospiraceae bacterium]
MRDGCAALNLIPGEQSNLFTACCDLRFVVVVGTRMTRIRRIFTDIFLKSAFIRLIRVIRVPTVIALDPLQPELFILIPHQTTFCRLFPTDLSMKLNLLSKLGRLVSNVENEAYYNEAHETSEPVFWLVFGMAMVIAVVSLYVAMPLRRWLGARM